MVADTRHGRFGPLDAMRGIGALFVVAYHASPLSSQVCDSRVCSIPFGFLAVDMFFVLSGFVISYSYDSRFAAGMNFRQFMVARVVRLYPIFFICALLGSSTFFWYALHGQASRGRLVVLLATNFLMLPAPNYPVELVPFPLVSPAWSLFFELFIANVSYALIIKRLTNVMLGLIILISFTALAVVVVRTGTIDGGAEWMNFLVGFPRVLFSFYAGVAVHRLFLLRKPPSVPSVILLALVAATFWPQLHGRAAVIYELFCAAVIYPALIYFGASARERIPKIGAALGNISYALYLVHNPILVLILHIGPHYGGVPQGLIPWSSFFLGSILIAFSLNQVYDRPARRFLAKLISRVPA